MFQENDKHPIFHHTFKANYDGFGVWGDKQYPICINSLGFKSYCGDDSKMTTNYDLVFIGDSFTEGIGMAFQDTFVGVISHNFPKLRIANMGVSSYSPSIYLSKVKNYIQKGFSLNHLIIYIDISDISDEVIPLQTKLVRHG